MCELQEVRSDVKQKNEKMQSMDSKMDDFIGLMQNQGPKQFPIPTSATSQTTPIQPTYILTQDLSSPRKPTSAYTGRYHIKDITNKKNNALGMIIESSLGKLVHGHELREFNGSYVAWPISLLQKMV